MAVGRRTVLRAVLMIGVCLTLAPATLRADSFSRNESLSRALTSYLQINNHFPLARAQVLDNSIGDRRVILFGFVASTDERITAELRAAEYLGDPWIDIVDQLKIRAELRAAEQTRSSTSAAPSPAGGAAAGASGAVVTQADSPTAQMPNDIQAYEDQFQTEMLGPGLAAFSGAVPFLGVATLVGVPFFVGIPVFGLAPLPAHSITPSMKTPAANGALGGTGLIGAGKSGLNGAGVPKSSQAAGVNHAGFEGGAMFNHFRPVGGLGRR